MTDPLSPATIQYCAEIVQRCMRGAYLVAEEGIVCLGHRDCLSLLDTPCQPEMHHSMNDNTLIKNAQCMNTTNYSNRTLRKSNACVLLPLLVIQQ